MTLTKALIARAIFSRTDIPKWRSSELVDRVFEVIKGTLEFGEDALISGFGKFAVREKKERKGSVMNFRSDASAYFEEPRIYYCRQDDAESLFLSKPFICQYEKSRYSY